MIITNINNDNNWDKDFIGIKIVQKTVIDMLKIFTHSNHLNFPVLCVNENEKYDHFLFVEWTKKIKDLNSHRSKYNIYLLQ